jgi:hypothetical protein
MKEARIELASGGTPDPDQLSEVMSALMISSGHWDNHSSPAMRLRNFDWGYAKGVSAWSTVSPKPHKWNAVSPQLRAWPLSAGSWLVLYSCGCQRHRVPWNFLGGCDGKNSEL